MSDDEHAPPERDRRILRRAVRTGLGVWLALAVVLGAWWWPAGGGAVFAGVSWALAAGALVSAAWTSLTLLADLFKDVPAGGARVRWTLAIVLLAIVAPLFAAAATATAVR